MSFIKVLVLEHELEALMMQEILEERGVPYFVHSLQDQAYGNLWQQQYGWGHLLASERDAPLVRMLYAELKASVNSASDAEPEPAEDSETQSPN